MANSLRQIRAAIQNPFPLPAEYLFPDAVNAEAKKAYESMSPADKLINGGKLWSMYDLMKYYHSGFMPTNNDANYIEYEIDFTHNDLTGEAKGDPLMVNHVKTKLLESFQPLSSMVESGMSKVKMNILTDSTKILSSAVSRPLRGGILTDDDNQNGQQPQLQPQMQQPSSDMFDGSPGSVLSPEYLTDRCLTSIGGITFNSLNRIFVTRTFASLPLVQSMDGKPVHLTGAQTIKQFQPDEAQAGGIKNKKEEHRIKNRTRRHHRSRREKREKRDERDERE